MKHHELDHSWSFQVPKIHQASFLRWTCDSQGSENSKRLLYNSGGDRPQGHITSCSQRSQWSRGKWCLTVIEIFRTMREMCRSGWNRTIPIKGKHHVFLKTRNCQCDPHFTNKETETAWISVICCDSEILQEPLEVLQCRPESSCPGGAPGAAFLDFWEHCNIRCMFYTIGIRIITYVYIYIYYIYI